MKHVVNTFKRLAAVAYELNNSASDALLTFSKKLQQSNLNRFNQSRLIENTIFWNRMNEDYPSLGFDGVCKGLSVDYARVH
jgi:hypothetical protein